MSKNRFKELAIANLKTYLLSQPNLFVIINDDSNDYQNSSNELYHNWLDLKNKWHDLKLKQAQLNNKVTNDRLDNAYVPFKYTIDSNNRVHINNSDLTDATDLTQNLEYENPKHYELGYQALEHQEVDWLTTVFNKLFRYQNVELIRGTGEPEYFPAGNHQPARIEFAHGFFASALHEISHWCIAGAKRRQLVDFGYWYAADGRNEAQQKAFEKVEIKPQAIECLFTLMCNKPFCVSQDNLFATFDTSQSTFEADVFNQAQAYIDSPTTLPVDANILLTALAYLCHDNPIKKQS